MTRISWDGWHFGSLVMRVTSQMVLCLREISFRQCLLTSMLSEKLRKCMLGTSAALWELWRFDSVTQQPSKHLSDSILVTFVCYGRPCALQSHASVDIDDLKLGHCISGFDW